jgi:hypothetical protein
VEESPARLCGFHSASDSDAEDDAGCGFALGHGGLSPAQLRSRHMRAARRSAVLAHSSVAALPLFEAAC